MIFRTSRDLNELKGVHGTNAYIPAESLHKKMLDRFHTKYLGINHCTDRVKEAFGNKALTSRTWCLKVKNV